jgi:hypothetical protein
LPWLQSDPVSVLRRIALSRDYRSGSHRPTRRTNVHVIDPLEIPSAIQNERLDVWVCSFGGSGTNMLANYLETKGLRVRTPTWEAVLCHHAHPINVQHDVKAVYVFGDAISAFRSQKHRGHLDANQQKLNNDPAATPSDDAFFASMMNQFTNWTGRNRTNLPILIVRFETLFSSGKYALGDYLNIDVTDFPARKDRAAIHHEFSNELDLRRQHSDFLQRLDAFPSSSLRPPSRRARLKVKSRRLWRDLIAPERGGGRA